MDKILKRLKAAAKILTILFAWLVGICMVFSYLLQLPNFKALVTKGLEIQTSSIVNPENDDAQPMEYYRTEFSSIAELQRESRKVVENIVAEGAVLLKNELVGRERALPLSVGDKVSLFDFTSVDPVWGGTGSGNAKVTGTSGNYPGEVPSYKDAFEDAGLIVNPKLWNWYQSNAEKYKRKAASEWPYETNINGVDWASIPASSGKADAEYGDAAIFILGRVGGEDRDHLMLTWDTQGSDPAGTNSQKGYLMLSDNERSVLAALKELKDNGTFQKLILLINSSNQPELDWLTDNTYGIDAAMWIGGVGETGLNAVGKLLTGAVNPSGRLSDMYWNKHEYNPVHANFGTYAFNTGVGASDAETDRGVAAGTLILDGTRTNHADSRYIVYQEGMYLGYRYAETRYEDLVLGRENVGDFDYNSVVAYPFGYGLSYTQFEYSPVTVTKRDYTAKPVRPQTDMTLQKTEYTMTTTVTNTGQTAGKEVVQVYMQRPYTRYDIQNGIEKPAVELVGFAKTGILQPGDFEEVSITVDEKYFAAYDSNGAGTYVLTGGDYYLTVGKNAHDAVNNILAAKGKTTKHGMTHDGNEKLVYKTNPNGDENSVPNTTKYAFSDATGQEIKNLFDFADINRYDGRGSNSVTYVSRNDWTGTLKFADPDAGVNQTSQVKLVKTQQMIDDMSAQRDYLPVVSGEYPTYGADNNITLAEMGRRNEDGSPVYAYDDPKWQEFLDRLTWDDYLILLSDGKRKTNAVDSVSKPMTLDHNGPIGFIHPYRDTGIKNSDNSSWPNDAGWQTWSGIDKQAGHGGLSEIGVDPVTKLPNREIYGKQPVQDPDRWKYPTAYPSNPVLAATFNVELIERAGEMVGEDGLWGGYNGIYGTGVNIHRSPYAGRAFEYFSEDGFLSGVMAGHWSRGCQSKGVYVYNKHLALNEQEYGRYGISTFINEQTFREIYLRAFEIPIVQYDAKCIMGALNRVGVQWSSACKALNTDWLRGEAGLSGFVVTDWWESGIMNDTDNTEYYMQLGRIIMAGTDLPDGVLTTEKLDRYRQGGSNENCELAWAMRESAHRIMYTVAHSNAMNGFTVNTRVVTTEPWITGFVNVCVVVTWVLFGVFAISFIVLSVVCKKRKAEQV